MSSDLSLNDFEINFKANGAGEIDGYEFANFKILRTNLLLLKDGQQVPLTPKAVETLVALVERSGEIVTKDELMQRIWGDAVVEESNLAQYLHILRKTLGTMPDGRPYIETQRRRGYRFNGEVRPSLKLPARVSSAQANDNPVTIPVSEISKKPRQHSFARKALLVAAAAMGCLLIGIFIFENSSRSARGELQQSVSEVIVMPLTSGENVTETTISHDGKFFAYVDYDGRYSRLRLQAVDQSSRSEIMPPIEAQVHNLSFSPDDKQIYYVISGSSELNNGLCRIPAKGGLPANLLDNAASPVSFSLKGTEMLFVRPSPDDGMHQQIVTASAADGSGERVLLTSENDKKIAPNAAWSPDGRSVVFGSINRQFPSVCSLMKLDLSDGSIAALTDEKWDSCYRVAFTHDGGAIAFVGTKQNDAFSTRRDQVYFLELGSRESRRLTGDGNWHDPMSLGMTDANEIIALPLNRVSELWTVDPNGSPGSAEQITQGQSDGRGGIVPTNDGKVAFLARDGDGFAIFETDANGQDRRRVLGAPTMQELRGGPEARFFIYAQQEGDFSQLFRTDRSGSEHRQLTFGKSTKIDSTVSPDGKWVAFGDTVFDGTNVILSLQRIPAEGGTPELLSNEYCGVPHYSNDGKFISCSSIDNIRIVSADTGALVSEMAVETPFVSNSGARWSPDDRELVYRVIKNGATNLWHQPVAGGQPQPLTKFAKGEVYNFAYSSDGKKVYLSRGAQIRNAEIIKNIR